MLIDCDACPVRGQACTGCVVNLLFAQAPSVADAEAAADAAADAEADLAQRRAIRLLVDAGFEVTLLRQEGTRPRSRSVSGRRRGHHAA